MTSAAIAITNDRPDLLARHLVQRDHGVFCTTRRTNHIVSIDENRFAVTPGVCLLAAKIFLKVNSPQFFASSAHTNQLALWSHNVDAVRIDSRSTSRTTP